MMKLPIDKQKSTKRTRHSRHWKLYLIGGLFSASSLTGCGGGANDSTFLADFTNQMAVPTPSQAVRDAFNMYDADKRRRAVSLLSQAPFGGEAPYLRTYRLLLDDPDPTVRAACLQALGLHGDPSDVEKMLPSLRDDVPYVRWEAAKALIKIHNPMAIDELIVRLERDEDVDVRMASAQALGQYPTRRVFDTLVTALDDVNFGVVDTAHQSLMTLTGQDLSTDGRDWLAMADETGRELFANQQAFTYQPYAAPPSILDRMQFWTEQTPPEPQTPTGLDQPDSSS